MTETASITFNINGGNNQILPNATQAVQNFYGDQFAEEALRLQCEHPQSEGNVELSEAEKALLVYINKVEVLKQYAVRLAQCTTAGDVARVVVVMLMDEKVVLDEYECVKERFIRIVMSLAPNVTSGRTVNNVRQRIIDAWDRSKSKIKKKAFSGASPVADSRHDGFGSR